MSGSDYVIWKREGIGGESTKGENIIIMTIVSHAHNKKHPHIIPFPRPGRMSSHTWTLQHTQERTMRLQGLVMTWLPDGDSQILRSFVFGPSGFLTMAPLRCAAKFDPFLSLDCAPTPSTLAQSKERKGSNFAIWQH